MGNQQDREVMIPVMDDWEETVHLLTGKLLTAYVPLLKWKKTKELVARQGDAGRMAPPVVKEVLTAA